eukprot:7391624-Prymnesium_polylepis.1
MKTPTKTALTSRTKEQQEILVLDCRADNEQGVFRYLSRRELLDEARTVVTPGAAPGTLLTSRDVRKVDPYFAARLEPVIAVRTGCITVSLGRTELRAIITRDRLYFVVPDGADSILTTVREKLSTIRKGDTSAAVGPTADSAPADNGTADAVPFELAALEAMLATASSELHNQQEQLAERVKRALQTLRRTVSGTRVGAGDSQLEAVRELKQEVCELLLQSQAVSVRAPCRSRHMPASRGDAIGACPRGSCASRAVLDEDEDMEAMYLTRTHLWPPAPRTPSPGAHRSGNRGPLSPARVSSKGLMRPTRGFSKGAPPRSPRKVVPAAHEGGDRGAGGEGAEDGEGGEGGEGGGGEGGEAELLEVGDQGHEEVEAMLESYVQEVGSTITATEALAYSIESSEKFVAFRLDSARNRLLKVEVLAT